MRILHAIHDFLPRHQAGSEIYAFNLAQAQQRHGLDVHVLCAEYDLARPHASVHWRMYEGVPVAELINNWAFTSFEETYRSPLLGRQLTHLLRALGPDLLHVHNFLNLSYELPAIARQLGIPTVATLHEYVLVCPSGGQRLHRAEDHVCAVIDPERCSRCFAQHPFNSMLTFGRIALRPATTSGVGKFASQLRSRVPAVASLAQGAMRRLPLRGPSVTAADMSLRLQAAQQVFDDVDLFVAPSPHLGAEFERLGVPRTKLRVSDYGFVPLIPARRAVSRALRIGFVGTLAWHKGVHVLLEAVRALPRDRFEVLVFGDTGTFPDYVATLREQARGLPVRFMGRFERESTPDVYAQMDVLVVPSLWPENSPLVIHEAFMCGLPVIGARDGGTQDLVADGVNGLLYDPSSPAELADALRRLLDGPALLKQLAAAVPAVKSIEEDAGEFATVYAEVVRRSGGVHAFPARAHDHAPTEFPATLAIVLNHRTPDDTLLAMASLRASQAPLHGSYVVENGSEDGRLEYLRSHLGDAELIVSGTNLGFSAGCNLGIRAALARGAARVFLMNSDAVLPPDSLAKMHAALDADPELGIVGPSVVSRSDPNQVLSQGMRFSTRTGRMRHLGFGRALSVLSAPRVCDVDAVSGCAMLITREVFDRIGLFEESYFFGFEDLDFCLRARADGFRTACVEHATVLHAGAASIGVRSPRLIYFATRNHLLAGRRAPGGSWLRPWLIAGFNVAHVVCTSPVPRGPAIRALGLGIRDYLRGAFGADPDTRERARRADTSVAHPAASTEPTPR